MNHIATLTPQQLRRAANIQEQILGLRKQLEQVLGGQAAPTAAGNGAKKRFISAAGKARIAAAARARWAKFRAGNKPAAAKSRPKPKFSAAARKRLADLARARWAKARAAGKKAL